jgi:hypothetical protein
MVEWTKQAHLKHQKFTKSSRRTYVDEIASDNGKKERSTPSPQAYNLQNAFTKFIKDKVKLLTIPKVDRTTLPDEMMAIAE